MFVGFKTRSDVLEILDGLLRRDGTAINGELRWSDDELALSINMALQFWSGSVSMPASYDYSLTAGYPTDLPWYVGGVESVHYENRPIRITQEILTWDHVSLELPSSLDRASLVFPLVNDECSIPSSPLTLSADYDAGDATMLLTIEERANVPEMGVLLLDRVWYAFVRGDCDSVSAELTILQAMTRGTDQAATVASGSDVEMALFVTDMALWGHLTAHCMATLHSMFAAYGSVSDIENHQWFMRWWDARADVLWKRIKPRPVQSRQALK